MKRNWWKIGSKKINGKIAMNASITKISELYGALKEFQIKRSNTGQKFWKVTFWFSCTELNKKFTSQWGKSLKNV